MPVVDLFDRTKKKVGEIELKDAVFSVSFEGKEVLIDRKSVV